MFLGLPLFHHDHKITNKDIVSFAQLRSNNLFFNKECWINICLLVLISQLHDKLSIVKFPNVLGFALLGACWRPITTIINLSQFYHGIILLFPAFVPWDQEVLLSLSWVQLRKATWRNECSSLSWILNHARHLYFHGVLLRENITVRSPPVLFPPKISFICASLSYH